MPEGAAATVQSTPVSENVKANERLIVALNQPTIENALELVSALEGRVDFYKIGLQLQMMSGVDGLIENLLQDGKRVFLDYKYYDIDETVKDAVARAAARNITFLTVHGNGDIIKAAVEACGDSPLKIFAVTVLTSLDADDLRDLFGRDVDVRELVLHRARKAIEYGCDGVIASSNEVSDICRLENSERLLITTPGIRLDGQGIDDHKRPGTPEQAITDGADYLVVGRPIINADDPVRAADDYIEVMQSAFDAL